ncbi:MAG: XshC-Cox1-family protein [Gammaproteobacteria bacterium]|nr:MAG: XshC-Cox1-family protein [Gammaproteobacteria bacterium]
MTDAPSVRTDSESCCGLRGLTDALWRVHKHDDTAVLGMVIATEGSTYRKRDALVLLDRAGLRHGVISGGCLEPALEEAARAVLEGGRAAVTEFDTRSDEDVLFGSGIGCRGRVRLLLLPLPPRAPLARALFGVVEHGAALDLALCVEGADMGMGRAGFVGNPTPHSDFIWDASGRDESRRDDALALAHRLRIAPPPQVLLLGAGPETAPFAVFARRLGWFVNVVEHRGRWAAFARAATIDELIDLAPEASAARLVSERTDAVILMSHNYAIDLTHLRACALSAIGYIGLLGPGARRDALLAELGDDLAAKLLPRLHAPVGLDLGGHGGEAVALAVAAELQQYFSARRA